MSYHTTGANSTGLVSSNNVNSSLELGDGENPTDI